MSEVQGRMDVATSERDMLLRKSDEAKVRVRCHSHTHTFTHTICVV